MYVWGLTEFEIDRAIGIANKQYAENLCYNNGPTRTGTTDRSSVTFTLRVRDSHSPGAKVAVDRFGSSKKGFRRTVSACWHAHRDVMKAIFEINPDARIKSAVADYRGVADFESKFPQTRYHNIGSIAYPVSFASSCLCESTEEHFANG